MGISERKVETDYCAVYRHLRENGADCTIYRHDGGRGEKKIFVSQTSTNDPCNLYTY